MVTISSSGDTAASSIEAKLVSHSYLTSGLCPCYEILSVFLSNGELCSQMNLPQRQLIPLFHVKFLHQQLQGQCSIAQTLNAVKFFLGNNIIAFFHNKAIILSKA